MKDGRSLAAVRLLVLVYVVEVAWSAGGGGKAFRLAMRSSDSSVLCAVSEASQTVSVSDLQIPADLRLPEEVRCARHCTPQAECHSFNYRSDNDSCHFYHCPPTACQPEPNCHYYHPKDATFNFAEAECPANWHYYNGNCYYTSSARAPQPDARSHCQTMCAELTSIRDQAEMDFVESITLNGEDYWFGLYKLSDGTTAWYDGNPSTYRDWALREPNEGPTTCIYYRFNGFADGPCRRQNYYTCKKLAGCKPGFTVG